MALSTEKSTDFVSRSGPVIAATTLIGVGMGGFIDGILLHQILQWHNMLSAKLPPNTLLNSKTNMFWDGIFHAGVWLVTMVGIIMLWNAVKERKNTLSNNLLAGGLLFGWGLFNAVEGIIDHQILVLHNVREVSENQSAWNLAFLLFSLIILFFGWVLIRRGRREHEREY